MKWKTLRDFGSSLCISMKVMEVKKVKMGYQKRNNHVNNLHATTAHSKLAVLESNANPRWRLCQKKGESMFRPWWERGVSFRRLGRWRRLTRYDPCNDVRNNLYRTDFDLSYA
mmetsp:Transcript_15249/g.27606  ORF Transcript_15249/g.27606 Transcript_15249/m.27606 type:complete len:113 (+) Transcript_15249:258-596(+)